MSALTLVQFLAIQKLYATYASILDSGQFEQWPELFTEECLYRLQSRENFDRGLPLATLSLESKGMLKDRVYGVSQTIYHDPYYQRHIFGVIDIVTESDSAFSAECNYHVIRTKRDSMPETISVGRMVDKIICVNAVYLFEQKICIFDNDLIANSIIYPI
jgi:salicylate 5-hydroxylase small subunit